MIILVSVYIYQYIPGKLEYIQVWETRPTQFPQDPPQRSQFYLDRQFRPWKKKLFQTKRNISTTARIEWEKKKAIHNEIFRPRNWFHTTQGLCVESLDAEIDLNPLEHSLPSALNNLLHVFLLWTIILDCYKKEHTWAILAMTAAVRSLSPTCWGETFFW